MQQIANPHEMYLNPANSFVASFMGNPPISYVDVQVDQGWAVLQNGLRIHCGSNHSGPARLGIRPEAWSLGDDLSVTLTDVEMRGQDQVISFLLADQPHPGYSQRRRIRASRSGNPRARVGKALLSV